MTWLYVMFSVALQLSADPQIQWKVNVTPKLKVIASGAWYWSMSKARREQSYLRSTPAASIIL